MWRQELILEFIGILENYPILWDPNYQIRKKRRAQHEAWLDIAKKLSLPFTVEELKKKKELLMTSYKSLRKKVEASKSHEDNCLFVPQWFAYESIDRFAKTIKEKVPSIKKEIECEEPPPNDVSQNEQNNLIKENEMMTQEEQGPSNDPICEISEVKGGRSYVTLEERKPSPTSTELVITKFVTQVRNASTLTSISIPQTQLNDDALALYGKLLTAKLRRLPEPQQLTLQNTIDNIIYEAEMKING